MDFRPTERLATTMKGLSAFIVIGLADALIHWQIFFVLCSAAGLKQAASNFAAFCIAAAFSFYLNVLYIFERETSVFLYLISIVLMATVSFGVELVADVWRLSGLVTVASFSLVNIASGYCVFRLGRLYPAKDAHMSGEDFRQAYPAWEQLESMRDPALMSRFWQRVIQ